MLNCSFSCIALQSGITQHGIKFLVTAITGLSVAQTQFSVLHSSFYRTNWSLFLFEEHWPTSWTLPIRVKCGAFHHLPFLWAALCTIIKFVLAGNWVIYSLIHHSWQMMDIQRLKQGFAVLSCDILPLQRKQGDFQAQVYYGIEFLPSTLYNDVQFSHLIWLVLTGQPLKHILSPRIKVRTGN